MEARVPAVVSRADRRLAPALTAAVLAAVAAWPFLRQSPEDAGAAAAAGFASPLVLDLDGRGRWTADGDTVFDIDGDGRPDRLRDLGPDGGILVFDANADGVPGQSGKELLGTSSDIDGDGSADGRADGFEALAALAHEAFHRGWITEASLRAGHLGTVELKALEAGFGLRVRVGGLRGRDLSLKDAGVAALRLSAEPSRRRPVADGAGSELSRRDGAAFLRDDGTPAVYADVWLKFRNALSAEPLSARR